MPKSLIPKQEGRFHSISNKMIFYYSTLFIVVMILIGAVTYRLISQILEHKTILDTQKIMEQTMINVDYYFNDIKSPMIMLARHPSVLHSLQQYTSADWQDRLAMRRELGDFTRNITLYKSYIRDILILGKNGFTYNINPEDEIASDYDYFEAPWLKEIIQSKEQGFHFVKSYKADYYLGSLNNQNVVSVVLNVRENRQEWGYIVCNIDLRKFNQIFNRLSLGENGYIYMIDPQGEIVFHPEPDRVGSRMEEAFLRQIDRSAAPAGSFTYKVGDRKELIVYARSSVTNWLLVGSIPYDFISTSAQSIRPILIEILAVSVILVVLISYLISIQITRPIKRLLERIKNVQTHDFKTRKTDYGKGEISIIGQKFENMVQELYTLIQEVYVSNLKQKEAELKVLQSQINPHFLYNSLQLVKAEALFGNHREVSSIVTSIGEMLRYPMYNQDDLVTLREEVDYVRHYLDIYKRRFKGKIDYELDIEPGVLECRTPKLILQPIVENSILHGFESLQEGGKIWIGIRRKDSLAISILDNGDGIPEDKLKELKRRLEEPAGGSSIGLANVNQRIKLRFGSAYGIAVESLYGEFTRVTLTLPLAT